jgi:hypothetical protein
MVIQTVRETELAVPCIVPYCTSSKPNSLLQFLFVTKRISCLASG